MATLTSLAPYQRQIFVQLGGRHIVFGSPRSLPEVLYFTPNTGFNSPAPVEQKDISERDILETLRVHAMKKTDMPELSPLADFDLVDEEGNRVLVELKVRESDPRRKDFDDALMRISQAAHRDQTLEVWYFNIDRLSLKIISVDQDGMRIDELTPLNIWQKTDDGVFERSEVIAEVVDWVQRVAALYEEIRSWLHDRPALRCEQSRTVTMSETLMRQFAVTDRDIPILDILEDERVAASFVPRGLWLIGSWGRIEIITETRTHVLLAMGETGKFEWRLVSFKDRRQTVPFDREALFALMGEA